MPRMKDDTIVEFLQEPHIGVIASTQKNGLPYTVPVWWLYDKGSFGLPARLIGSGVNISSTDPVAPCALKP